MCVERHLKSLTCLRVSELSNYQLCPHVIGHAWVHLRNSFFLFLLLLSLIGNPFMVQTSFSKDTFLYGGEKYSLPKHGFARRREFEILEMTQNSVSFVLRSDAKTHLSYPFDFELCVAFSVDENVIKTVYSVISSSVIFKNDFIS